MDIERIAAECLMARTGIACVLEVPPTRPEEFVSVELSGGTSARFVKRRTLIVQSWAKTRRRAAEIAGLVEEAVPELADVDNVFAAAAAGTYRWPDPDSGMERYQTTVELTTCE